MSFEPLLQFLRYLDVAAAPPEPESVVGLLLVNTVAGLGMSGAR